MKSKSLVVLAGIAVAIQIIWFLLPQAEWRWLSEDELVILSYAAFGSTIDVQPWLSWFFFGVSIAVLIAVLVSGAKMRHLLLVFWIGSLFIFVPFGGIVAETGFSMTLRDLSNIVVGAMLAIAYTTTPVPAEVNDR